jgi:hypothetical protein
VPTGTAVDTRIESRDGKLTLDVEIGDGAAPGDGSTPAAATAVPFSVKLSDPTSVFGADAANAGPGAFQSVVEIVDGSAASASSRAPRAVTQGAHQAKAAEQVIATPSPQLAIGKIVTLSLHYTPPTGLDERNYAFFYRPPAAVGAPRSFRASEWTRIPTTIDTVTHTASATTNVVGQFALLDARLVPQYSYTAYMPSVQPGTLLTSVTVQNLGSTTATVTLAFTRPNGTRVALGAGTSYSIGAGQSRMLYLPALFSLESGLYAATVVSTQPIAVVANATTSATSASTGYSGLSFDSSGLRLAFPQVYRAYFGFDSTIVLQNTDTATASVTLTYLDRTGARVASDARTIPAGASVTIDQSTLTALPLGFAGSVLVTSDRQVAGIVNVSAAGGAQLSTVAGVTEGASQAFLPSLYRGYYGFDSSIVIQNVDNQPNQISLTYANGVVRTATLAAGTSMIVYQPSEAGLPSWWQGSAVVRSTNGKRLVAVVNIANSATGRLTAYNGAADGAAQVALPAVYSRYSSLGWASSVSVQNVGATTTDVRISYGDGTTQTIAGLAPGAGALVYQPNVPGLTAGWQGAATVSGDARSKLVAVVNEEAQMPGLATPADWLISYVGVSR